MSLIESIGEKVNTYFVDAFIDMSSDVQNIVNSFFILVQVYLVCWILYNGYQILWGRNNRNVKDFMWDSFLKFIFIMIASNYDSYAFMVKEFINGLHEGILIGGLDLYGVLQSFSDDIASLSGAYWDKAGISNFGYFFASAFVWIGFAIGVLPILMSVVVNTLSFQVLLLITPIVFFCLIFDILKGVFQQWLSLITVNFFTLLFLHLFCKGSIDYALEILSDYAGDGSDANGFFVCIVCILAGIMILIFTKMAIAVAERMANVSLESVTHSVASSAGRATGVGMAASTYGAFKGGKTIGKLGLQAGKGAYNYKKADTATRAAMRSEILNKAKFWSK